MGWTSIRGIYMVQVCGARRRLMVQMIQGLFLAFAIFLHSLGRFFFLLGSERGAVWLLGLAVPFHRPFFLSSCARARVLVEVWDDLGSLRSGDGRWRKQGEGKGERERELRQRDTT
jgi:hypothetical protein